MKKLGIDRLIERIVAMQSPCVAGLDPVLDYIPAYILEEKFAQYDSPLEAAAEALFAFNQGIIDEICDIFPAVKPQSAFYEMYGWQGVRALEKTIRYAKEKGMFVILDVKRGDIGSTASAYANAYIGQTKLPGGAQAAFDADCVTVNAYLGSDGVKPFVEACGAYGNMVFTLVKTSNPSSGELQDKCCGDKRVYALMGELCERWGSGLIGEYGYSSVGAVVGATYPKELAQLRAQMPHTFFLVPGYGAQGGGGADVVGAFDSRGIGGIVNSSRGIMCAYRKAGCAPRDYAKAARAEAIRMRDEIMAAIRQQK